MANIPSASASVTTSNGKTHAGSINGEAMRDKATSKAHSAVDQISELAGNVEQRVSESVDTIRAQSAEYSSKTEAYVRQNPLKSLGMAFAAGIAISAILKK